MQVIFTRDEVEQKLKAALALEGLEVLAVSSWDEEGVKLQVQLSPPEESPVYQRMDVLEESLLAMGEAIHHLRQRAEPPSRRNGKESTDPSDPAGSDDELVSASDVTEKIARVKAEIKKEESYVGSPFGGTLTKAARRRSANEYDTFPGE